MTCPKCAGLMIREQFSDYFLVCYSWKCVNCGAVVDTTIAKNQQKPPVPESVSH
jgi:uncharacterized Zn finger protein